MASQHISYTNASTFVGSPTHGLVSSHKLVHLIKTWGDRSTSSHNCYWSCVHRNYTVQVGNLAGIQTWWFGSLPSNHQIKIRQDLFITYMAILYWNTKLQSLQYACNGDLGLKDVNISGYTVIHHYSACASATGVKWLVFSVYRRHHKN